MFFYGAGDGGDCGATAILYLGRYHYYQLKLGVGRCTNTHAKLLALWGISHVANLMGLPSIELFGDS